jgi:recombination protein RecR
MRAYPESLARLIEELERLPGIGPKSAQRLALHLLQKSKDEAQALCDAIRQVKESIHTCPVCFNYTDAERCSICTDPQRSSRQIAVVSEARDLLALERAGGNSGRYHVLQGLISPMEGMGPDALRIRELLARVRDESVEEVILATDPTVEGDATATYLAGLLKPLGVKVTRIALGLPAGGDLDYADELTITRALEGRREM